ncbi:MAG: glycosyltransferase family 39 protein [Planctomycetaceae bacterium]|jgi:hypothetical protein|nr:glycosyltransferase family 39 protein [Planctomycetaceae bacterium]
MFSKDRFLLFFVLIILAGVMRFSHLGTWSFAMDELFTPIEAHVLMGEMDVPEEYLEGGKQQEQTQLYRLPRALFVAYFIHWVDYKLFGEDEFGSRILVAVIGSLNIGIIFAVACPLFGTRGSLILSLLIMLFPEHLLNSQNNRFYCISFLLITVVFLLGGYIVQKRSVTAAVWIGPLAVLMVFSHTLGGLIWGILLAGIFLDFVFSSKNKNEKYPVRIFVLIGIWSLLLVLIAFFYLKPILWDWNFEDRQWGYTPFHSAAALVNRIGWSFTLLSCFGTVLLLTDWRNKGNIYWTVCVVMSLLAVFLLPLKTTFYPWYCFLFSFPIFVAVSLGINRIYFLLVRADFPYYRLVGNFWISMALLLNFPSFVSYYLDGNRLDYRSSCQHIREHWQKEDCITADNIQITEYYLSDLTPVIPLRAKNTPEFLQELAEKKKGKGRIWIIVHHHRNGLDQHLLHWLGRFASYEAQFRKKRFDYIENNVEVFLVPRKETPQ